MTIIKKTNVNKRCWGHGEREWEYKLVSPLWKSVWTFSKGLRTGPLYDPAVSLLGLYLKDSNSTHHRNACTSLFIAALFTVAKTCPQTVECVKMWHIYTMAFHSATKENEIMTVAIKWWMGGAWNYCIKWRSWTCSYYMCVCVCVYGDHKKGELARKGKQEWRRLMGKAGSAKTKNV